MSEPTTIIGGPVSPYVRKVMAVCDVKGVAYRIDPIIPFQGNDEFSRLSPLRRIPVLIDDQVTLSDSTVIAEYLDERHGTPGLFPDTPAARARARWVEEFAILALAMCSSGACLMRRSSRRACGSWRATTTRSRGWCARTCRPLWTTSKRSRRLMVSSVGRWQ